MFWDRFLRSFLSAILFCTFFSNIEQLYAVPVEQLPQLQDTIKTDSTAQLPFPFEDQPAFGQTGRDSSKLYLNKPKNLRYEVEYDPISGKYVFYEKIGDLNYRLPQALSFDDYIDYDFEKSINDYWKQRRQVKDMESESGLIPKLTIGGEAFNRVFGGNTVNIQPQGYVEVSLGYQMNTTENPSIPERNRKVPTFDFDEKIQMSVTGQIGTKMNMRVNYNTESTFDYENKMKLEYAGDEDEILKSVEAGNVSLPLDGTLITGASNLFGIKTEMQFGKLNLTTLFSQNKGETTTVETEGGASSTVIEINGYDYDANRHFFLSHYFKDHYNEALQNLPVIRSSISINKIEVWVLNRSNSTSDVRNIVAFQDLGEHKENIHNTVSEFSANPGLVYPENVVPFNGANKMYNTLISAYSSIRDVENVTSTLSSIDNNFVGGRDFVKVEQARMLSSSEYSVNEKLGYISLNSSIGSGEILAVAYSYTVNGITYQVGEFSTDGIDAPQTLIVKLLKGTKFSPSTPTWTLMMKNIYNLNASSLSEENFTLNVKYLNDSTGNYINYIPEGNIKGNLLLRVMNLDKLDSQQDPNPDGFFDFIDGVTVNSETGRIIFPVLEPFGSHLADSLKNKSLIEKYCYQSLYDSTKTYAKQDAEHNKFLLTGSFEGASTSTISLGGINITEGSVTVTAGGIELTENIDYTVDYTLGAVTIINSGLLESGTAITVSSESEELYSSQRKTLLGTHANYAFSDNFNLGATLLHMQEKPLTSKVDYGEDPISNTIFGFDTRYATEAPILTKIIDKLLPFQSTNSLSSINFEGEYAQLIPGHSSVIGTSGNVYIDDFEGTSISISMKTRKSWVLASTPQQQLILPEGDLTNSLEYGYNRAKLAWYNIDALFLRNNTLTPAHIKTNPTMQSNHYVREIYEKEVYPDKETDVGETSYLTTLDLAYYPSERGPYNYDTNPTSFSSGINSDGTLAKPETRWGGVMREVSTTDFEAANIESIEFWLLDPFIYDTLGTMEGGDLYFNLGEISEDILKDSRKAFENGLPTTGEVVDVDTTTWGRVSALQSYVNSFENSTIARTYQDIGLDGLNDEDENTFFNDYLNKLSSIVDPDAYSLAEEDPSSDNFHYFRGSDYDADKVSILERYKKYNGLDRNSPTAEMSEESYTTSESTLPDIEDINDDNTLNEYEEYYQYKISMRPEDFVLGENHISDVQESTVELKNGTVETIRWYKFKIPISEPDETIGSISDFSSIRFMRMFLYDFKEPIFLRFASLDLVRSEWREYTNELTDNTGISTDASIEITSVNIEENANRDPVNYVLPPGVTREIDPASAYLTELNEQSLMLQVDGLEEGDAKAVYKSINLDFRNYEKLKMFVHAEAVDGEELNDDDLYFFIRLGTDYNYNYYEYEMPLLLTPEGEYNGNITSDRYIVWPDSNQINVPLDLFTEAKQNRNEEMRTAGSTLSLQNIYEVSHEDWNGDRNTVKVKGSPNLGDVEVIMMGVRHKDVSTVSPGAKSVVVWLNELRLAGINEEGGWAANARTSIRLADLGSVNVAGSASSQGFGSIDSDVNSRSTDNVRAIDISSSLDLGKLLPEKTNLKIPMYFGYSENRITPKYDPLNPDIELEESLKSYNTKHARDSVLNLSQEVVKRKSINFTNVKFEPKADATKTSIIDPSNFSFSYAYNETEKKDVETELNLKKTVKGMLSYSYSTRPKAVSPFKKIGFLNKGPLKLLGDFSFYPLPAQINFSTDIYRYYNEIRTRNITDTEITVTPSYDKEFLWNRNLDIKYDVTRLLKIDFSSNSTSKIDEPEGRINRHDADYEWKKDSIMQNILDLGRPTDYNHTINASYTLPLSKLKLLNFMTATARYQGGYYWEAGAVTADSIELGNVVQNSQSITLTGNANLTNLYNKIPYFNEVNSKFKRTGKSRYSLNRSSSKGRNQQKQEPAVGNQKEEKIYSENSKLTAGKGKIVTHKLNTKKVKIRVLGVENKAIPGKVKIIDANSILYTPSADADQAMITVSGKPGDETFLKKVLDLSTRVLIGVRNVTVNYSKNGSTILPGYLPEPSLFGAGKYTPDRQMFSETYSNGFAPGMPFLLGWQNENFARDAANNGWITTDSTLNSPFQMNRSERITMRSTIEPLPDLRITLSANRSYTNNFYEYYYYNPSSRDFQMNSHIESGTFSMSVMTLGTAFSKIGSNSVVESEAFEKFKDYRLTIARRLATQRSTNPEYNYDPSSLDENGFPDGFGATSVDVLVPAFLAAYQDKSPYTVSLGMFPSLKYIRPNWTVQYEGMVSKIPALNKIMKSMNFTHSYSSTYSVGSYTSNLNYFEQEDGFSYVRDLANNLVPVYDVNSVSIKEVLSPLINLSVIWNNDLTTNSEISRSRSVSLSFSNNQLTEVQSSQYSFNVGYRFENMDMIIKTKKNQKLYSNDLNVTAGFSLTKNKTTLRKLDEPDQLTAGQSMLSLETTADYRLSDKFQVRLYFDKVINDPYTSSSYKTSTTNIGVSFKFTLTQ
ncbi:cell surface protein SprA [Maribellus comscasis]|uniref:Cell surface protein SprA n=1 Tax=Maribellus comscasis TaxID=2681766 RepID=A0A6I6JMF9_9BACT|nr:cell surface protein SprA [Maribellus comscasis]QGY44106.1 cell surface protein SprA [Maribellus comscasis]